MTDAENPQETAALYVDGFNLYYGVSEMEKPHLKWLNIKALGEFIAAQKGHSLVSTVFCSAYNKKKTDSYGRHRAFVSALEIVGVDVILGTYSHPERDCKKCGNVWKEATEKQTDVNLALRVIKDAYETDIKHIYLLSADADQGATAKLLANRFPDRVLMTIAPPNRELSDAILSYAKYKLRLNEDILEKCLFDKVVTDGKRSIIRPADYDPPAGWVHPRKRPKKQQGAEAKGPSVLV